MERVNIIRKVCSMPFMLITGLCVLPARDSLSAETVVGGIASASGWRSDAMRKWDSPECQERSA
jgi:hypothetical protein